MATSPPPGVPPDGSTAPPRRAGTAGADSGTPYHRLARTRRHRWWRPALGTLVLFAVWLAGMATVVTGFALAAFALGLNFLVGRAPFFSQPVLNIAVLLTIIVVAIPAVVLAAWGVQRRPAGTLSSVTGRLRWRWLAACCGLALLAVLAALLAVYIFAPSGAPGVGSAAGAGWVGGRRFLVAAAVLAALVPMQSAAEEYVFRGWIIQTAGAYLRGPWVGVLAGAVLFALAHGLGTGWGFADLMLFGLVAGWLTVRTGGLEPAIALHAANNLLAFLLSAAFGSLGTIQTAAQASWVLFAVDLVVLPLYAWLITRLARRMSVASEVPAPPVPA